MTRNSRRFLCLALAALLLAALLPAALPAAPAAAEDTLGVITNYNVNFRVSPAMSANTLFQLPIDTVLVVLSKVNANGYDGYQVQAKDPKKTNGTIYTGYVRGDCFRLLSETETAAYSGDVPSTTADPNAGSAVSGNTDAPEGTVGWVSAGGVNFRASPGKEVLRVLDRGTQVTVLSIPSVISSSNWYKVEYEGQVGYIMSTFLNLNGSGAVVTAEPTVTQAPSDSNVLGYVMTIKGSVNIRASIGGTVLTTVSRY